MRKLNKLTRRALTSCPIVVVAGLLAHATFSNQAQAQTVPPTCASQGIVNPIYVEGSTAADSVIKALGPKLSALASPVSIVYVSGGTIGSCDGVDSILNATPTSANATYWTAAGTATTCTLTAQVMDVGISDVFPTSCPVQSMNFVVPAAAQANSISSDAAYLTVGLGATGGTDWNVPADYAFRNFNSGTETMIATAIGVPTAKWPAAADKGGSGAVVTFIGSPTTPADTTIGILASNQADANRSTIKRLAFQAKGETCALYPDSSFAATDKANVRNGTYKIWGPSHILAKVDGTGAETDAKAKTLIDIIEGTTVIDGVDLVTLEINANTTPQCAMHVKRTAEIGTPVAYVPDTSCSCYFDSLKGDASACTACTTANAATVCPAGKTACNYGFCEVK
jgi:ABC-type phosphate transport system substrate-binding protein